MATPSATTVVVTAAEGSFSDLGALLHPASVRVIQHALLDFTAPDSWSAIDAAIRELARYRVLVVTSPRGARAFADRWRLQHEVTPNEQLQVWSSGATTAAALAAWQGRVRTPPPELVRRLGASVAIARAILSTAGPGDPVLYACGADRRDELPTMLRHAGMEVTEAVCYRTVLADEATARAALDGAQVVVVTSPNVVSLLARSCPEQARPALVAVGPTTATRARSVGWEPAAIADRPDVAALAESVRALLATR
jgi:uroporphyrinogen-III synthase